MSGTSWREVPIPKNLANRPTDDRGFTIPFATLMVDGKPDFTTLDAQRIHACMTNDLCGLCGIPLDDGSDSPVSLIGGPLSIQHRNFLDPPMHEQCAAYAMQVCPHIVMPTARYAKPTAPPPDVAKQMFTNVAPNRPERFGQLVCRLEDLSLARFQGQPIFLVRQDAEVEVRWEREPQFDKEGRELHPYFDERRFTLQPHKDESGEQCPGGVDEAVSLVAVGRFPKDKDGEIDPFVHCVLCHRLVATTWRSTWPRSQSPKEGA